MSRSRGLALRTSTPGCVLAMAAAAALAGLPLAPARAQQGTDRPSLEAVRDEIARRLGDFRASLGPRPGGVLGLFGYNVTPDGSTNAVTVNRNTVSAGGGDDPRDTALTLGQLGAGFTVSPSVPVYLEGYLGYARYDPSSVFSGTGARRVPFKWNNVAGTIGIGYDIRLGDYLVLRPIFNASLGYAASDLSLAGEFIRFRTGVDIEALRNRRAMAYGLGGSLVLAYYDYRPERDIDLELRYTQIHLQTFGDTLPAAAGSAVAQTLGLWSRYRWPTGLEAFTRPVRWVLEASGSYYLGDQRDALGFAWSVKAGGGIEVDVGRYEVGLAGINLSRVRLIGRYFHGDKDVRGVSFGIGMSF